MTIGRPLVGLSLLLPFGLMLTIWLARNVAISVKRAPNGVQTWLAASAAGYVGYFLAGLVGTELLSAFDALNRRALTAWWVGYALVVCGFALWFRPSRRMRAGTGQRPAWFSVVATSLFGLVAGFLFWLGVTTAPNDPDALLYHLSRASAWASHGNVDNIPTYYLDKLYYGRLDEYSLTNILVLDGSDHLVFLPEWIAFVVSVAMVTGLARMLGGRRSAALIGLLLAGTLPLGLMQATDTQNDMVVASLVLAAFYLSALLWRLHRPEPLVLVLIGMAAGVAVLTKTSAALALGPLAVAIAVMAWRDHWTLRVAVRWGAVAVIVAAVLALPLLVRNWQIYHNPIGSGQSLQVATVNPGSLALNGVRNLVLDLDTLRPSWNQDIVRAITAVGHPFGLDRPSPATNFQLYGDTFNWPRLGGTPTEGGSGSLVALAAIIVALCSLMSRSVRLRLRMHELRPVLAASVASLVLLAVVLRWQPWGGRLQLIALLPGLAAAAAIISALSRRAFIVVSSVLVAASLVLLPLALFEDAGKPLVGTNADYLGQTRNQQMLRWCPAALGPYVKAVDEAVAAGEHQVGYITWGGGTIYPILVLLSQAVHGAPVDVPAVGIEDASGRDTRPASAEPRVVIVLGPTRAGVSTLAQRLSSKGYRLQSVTDAGCEVIGIYIRH